MRTKEKIITTGRILKPCEQKYTFSQSNQISFQTGFIGYLRADFGSKGNEFFTSWFNFDKELNTDEFHSDIDLVINSCRLEKNSFLNSIKKMSKFCNTHPVAHYDDERNFYGIRIDTEKYAYLMKLNPVIGDYNFYCYCYVRDMLDNHLKKAEKGIRFIDTSYNTKFFLLDGGKIRIVNCSGNYQDKQCRYIDDTHFESGSNIYHICQFAELCEQNESTVISLNSI